MSESVGTKRILSIVILRSCFEFLRKIFIQLFLNLFPVFFPVLIRHIARLARYAPHKNK